MSIKDNIDDLKKDLENYDANLLAVTKTHGIDKIMEVYNYGLRDFGENKVQELIEKKEKMRGDVSVCLMRMSFLKELRCIYQSLHRITVALKS